MSAVAGILAVGNANTTDLVGEYQETILVRNAKGMNAGTTLFGLMSRLRSENSENSEFHWFERDPVQREIFVATANATPPTVPTGASPDGTSPTSRVPGDAGNSLDQAPGVTSQGSVVLAAAFDGVSTTSGNAWPLLAGGQVLRNQRTGEYMLVTDATPTSNTVNVLRAFHASTAQAASYTLVKGDKLAIITLGKDEGANPVRAAYEEPGVLKNYIQTFNATVELTNAFKGNKLRTDIEGPLRDRRIQALEKIGKDIELAFLLGVKEVVAGSNGYQYFTGGLKDSVDLAAPSNVLDGLGGTGVTVAAVNAWLSNFMVFGSDAKLALCGPAAYAAISNFANQATAGFRIMNQEQVYGMNITVINTPFGELDLAFHPLLKEISSFTDWMFVVDLAHIIQKTMEPLFLEPNIQTPGQDSYKEQYRAKLGLKLKFAEAFGYAHDLSVIKVS